MSKTETAAQKEKNESLGKIMEKTTQENLNAIDKETNKFNEAWIDLQKECLKGYVCDAAAQQEHLRWVLQDDLDRKPGDDRNNGCGQKEHADV